MYPSSFNAAPRGADPVPFRTRRFAETTIRTHFGELIQGEFHHRGGIVRGLVTLPCPALICSVTVELTPWSDEVRTEPAGMYKAERAARRALARIGLANCGAIIRIRRNAPEGIGAGTSTGDVVGAIYAAVEAAGHSIRAEDVARLAVEVETASDSTMFQDNAVRLFAQRLGETIEVLGDGLPHLWAVGILVGKPVDTVGFAPAEYGMRQIHDLDGARETLKKGVILKDPWLVGAAATRSAEINENFLEKENFLKLRSMADRCGAVGISVSHSGSAFAFLFDASDPARPSHVANLLAELHAAAIDPFIQFEVGGPAQIVGHEKPPGPVLVNRGA